MAIVILIGRRGYGKTTMALRLLKEAASRSAKGGVYAFAPNGLPKAATKLAKPLESLQEIQNLSEAAILIDDASAYLKGALHEAYVREAVVSSRHKKLHLFFVYHNVAQTPPFLFSLADTVIFFGLTDSKEALKQKLGAFPELYRTALRALSLPKYKYIAYNLNTHKVIQTANL